MMDEIRIGILGNVDSGKSTIISVLKEKILDNGRGLARTKILKHKHEKETGRTIPKSLRFEILKRDSFTCQYCGRSAPNVTLHIDHIIPWSKVKEHKIENLQVACSDCNLGKSDKLLNE